MVAGAADRSIIDIGSFDRAGRRFCAGSFYLHFILGNGQGEKNRDAAGDRAGMCGVVPGEAMVNYPGGGTGDRAGGVAGTGCAGWYPLGLDEAVGGIGLGLGEGNTYGDVLFGAGAAGIFCTAAWEDRVAAEAGDGELF
jgi:hypothetical protein